MRKLITLREHDQSLVAQDSQQFGTVYKVRFECSQEEAIKMFDRLMSMKHPNLLLPKEWCYDQDEQCFIVTSDYSPRHLAQVIGCEPIGVMCVVQGLCSGLQYLS